MTTLVQAVGAGAILCGLVSAAYTVATLKGVDLYLQHRAARKVAEARRLLAAALHGERYWRGKIGGIRGVPV